MIGMVLVTHGQLATGFRAALEHVVGPQSQLETITIGPDDDMEQRRSDILNAAGRVQDGAGVVILTDMFGGTPSNLAISVMDGGRIEVICGVNLPMLIKLATISGIQRSRSRGRRGARSGTKVHHGRKQSSRGQMTDINADELSRANRRAVSEDADREPQGPARAGDS